MYSSFDFASYVPEEGMLQLFVPDLSIFAFETTSLSGLTSIEFIAPNTDSITLINLIAHGRSFVLNTSLSSNANILLAVNASLSITQTSTLEAMQIFVTTYAIDQKKFSQNAPIAFDPAHIDYTIFNHGNITSRQAGAAIAAYKFIDKGYITANIDCTTFVALNKGQVAKFYGPTHYFLQMCIKE